MSAENYLKRAKIFWNQTGEHLRKGELEKASESAWGSTAQMVKAAAAKRGFEISHHKQFREFIKLISAQLGDKEIYDLFEKAERLHSNFYEGEFDEWEVREKISNVNKLMRKLFEIYSKLE
ncbi:MAG: PaREP1 family protein [Nitrososphaerales archaeon]